MDLGYWVVPRCRGQGAHSCSALPTELLGISWSIYKLPATRSLWVSALTGAICRFRGQNIIFRGKNPSNFTRFLIIHILPSHPFIASHSSLFLMTQLVISCLHWTSLLSLCHRFPHFAARFLLFFPHCTAGSRVPTLSSQYSRSSKAMKAYDLYFLMKSVKTPTPITFSIKVIVKVTSFSSGDHLKSHRTN